MKKGMKYGAMSSGARCEVRGARRIPSERFFLEARSSKLEAYSRAQRGVTVMLVLGFMGIFALIMGTVTSYVFEQGKYGRALSAREQAVHIAESGLEYYRWGLAHGIFAQSSTVATTTPVNDPEGGTIGNATITPTPKMQCGTVQWIDLSSRGTSNASPNFPRTLLARHMKPSVAEYSYLLNSSVYAGSDRRILGPYRSNGGIRMDGTNNSDVTSASSTWYCDSSFGCNGIPPNPPEGSKNGVFGAGSGYALWQWGVGMGIASVDFAGMAANFPSLQAKAQASGIYLPYTLGGQTAGGSDQRGYHIIFNPTITPSAPNGSIDVWRVTSTITTQSQHSDNIGVWVNDNHIIPSGGEVFIANYPIPPDCSLIYSEAKTWIGGTVAGKVTIIAADATGSGYTPDIILAGNINYLSLDGSVGLTAVAQRSVLIPLNSPDPMTLRGIFVAQSGYYGRNYYTASGSRAVPAPYNTSAYITPNTLNTIGTVVSFKRTGTNWTSGGTVVSGYKARNDSYDRLLAFQPSPFTPSASVDYKLALWREQ